jgi:Domain of unknown function DUF29
MTISTKNKLQELYQSDDYLWLQQTIQLLKTKDFESLDIESLIEELESFGRSEFNKVRSLSRQIIIYLLLLEYWEQEYELNYRHWQGEIIAFRDDLSHDLTASLQNKLLSELDAIYHVAVKVVVKKTELSPGVFPVNCCYSLAQILDENWYPSK